MKTMRNAAGVALLLFAAGLVPAWAQQTAAEQEHLAHYQKYAKAPVDHVHYFQITGFEYLAPDKLALWFGVNKMYLLTVQTPCTGLAYANAIALSAKSNDLYSNLDFVKFDSRSCKITKIVPVDELKMKQDAGKAKAAASATSG